MVIDRNRDAAVVVRNNYFYRRRTGMLAEERREGEPTKAVNCVLKFRSGALRYRWKEKENIDSIRVLAGANI